MDVVYNSAYMTAQYLLMEFKEDLDVKINIVGNQGLKNEIQSAGFKNAQLMHTVLDGEEEYDTSLNEKQHAAFQPDPNVKAIVNGVYEPWNFRELAIAAIYLGQEGMRFITTNDDPVFISDIKTQKKMADVGAFLGSLETLSGRKAFRVGKPNPLAFQSMLQDHFPSSKSSWNNP